MPIHHVKGGYKWGSHGHTYSSRKGAERQAAAAYAHGYKGKAITEAADAIIVKFGPFGAKKDPLDRPGVQQYRPKPKTAPQAPKPPAADQVRGFNPNGPGPGSPKPQGSFNYNPWGTRKAVLSAVSDIERAFCG